MKGVTWMKFDMANLPALGKTKESSAAMSSVCTC